MVKDELIDKLDSIGKLTAYGIKEAAFLLERSAPPSRGADPTECPSHLNFYLNKYWPMHNDKQNDAYDLLFQTRREYFTNEVNLVDWGCGQGLASFSFIEFTKSKQIIPRISSITLIDESELALVRAKYICSRAYEAVEPITLVSDLNHLDPMSIPRGKAKLTIHFFSNILDVPGIDLSHIISCLVSTQQYRNLAICMSPFIYDSRNRSLTAFAEHFKQNYTNSYSLLSLRICKNGEPCKKCGKYFEKFCRDRFTNRKSTRHELIFEFVLADAPAAEIIDFPPIELPVAEAEPARDFKRQLQAAYAPDPVISDRKYAPLKKYIACNSYFSVSSRSISEQEYSDLSQYYAVLANQIMRGVPTFLPIDLAEKFDTELSILIQRESKYGAIHYAFKEDWDGHYTAINDAKKELIKQCVETAWLQLAVLIFLIHKDIRTNTLFVSTPGFQQVTAINAIESLNQMLSHLTTLSGSKLAQIKHNQGDHVTDRDVTLKIEMGTDTEAQASSDRDHSIAITRQDWSKNDDQYQRKYYSRELIKYSRLYDVSEEAYDQASTYSLTYFLRTLFRKKKFIEGQLDILRHALRLDSVIGLLPTGGGKSLIYQLSALMQPGFALVIEPIKSLMKDQYDEMLMLGIDSVYINSDKSKADKATAEFKMLSGQSLFTLISPERMQIQEFRNALMDMAAEDNYFNYFVVDEAHCVSEWGHDFRPSYLSLAANANRFCKPFDAGDITVIGLTATASFDVLTDVQAELEIKSQKPIQVEKALSLKRDEIVYKFIRFSAKKNTEDGKKIESIKLAKRQELLSLLNDRLIEDINSVNRTLGQESKNFLINGNTGIKLNDETGIIVFCPHATGVLGVSTKVGQKTDNPVTGTYEFLARELQIERNIKPGYYRGGLESDFKDSSMEDYQRLYKENRINLMVATKAFGMGFNKPNIRFSVHLNFPGSIEGFSQETGRIGRDRKLALAYLMYSDLDMEVPRYLHDNNYLEVQRELELTKKILNYKDKTENKSINDCLRDKGRKRDFVIEVDSDDSSYTEYIGVGKRKNKTVFGKIIYRLALVGVIDDYTIEYRKSTVYRLTITPKERESLTTTMKNYLMRYFTEKKAQIMVDEFFKNKDKPNYSDLIRYYIEFEHNYIKKKREQAISDMDFACRYGLDNQDSDPLSEKFREYIDVYFSSKYFRDNYFTPDGREASLTNATERGKVQSEDIITLFIDIVKNDAGGLIPNCKELRGACIRLLNDNPNNYSLHILNAFTNIIISKKKTLEFNQGTKELLKGVSLYLESRSELLGFKEFKALLGTFWHSVSEEMPDFENHLHQTTGYDFNNLETLAYLASATQSISKTVKGD